MAKSELRLKARELRKKGVSVRTIASELGVSKSMASIWVRDIILTIDQFGNTSFKKVVNTKIYDNFNDHYGTFQISVKNPAKLFYKIIGLIEGLRLRTFKEALFSGKISNTRQGSSVG